MGSQVAQFISKCLICQQIKESTNKPIGLLQSLAIPERIWEDISMDFITGLPKVKGKAVIVTVVDRLSKFCHLGSLPASYNASLVARFFVRKIVKIHGFPQSIVSDRD